MSAFIPAKEHIDILVALAQDGPRGRDVRPDHAWYGPRWTTSPNGRRDNGQTVSLPDFASPDAIGQMLVAAVVRSVSHRYPDDTPGSGRADAETLPGHHFDLPYTFTRQPYRLTAVEGLAAVGCYEYQACEHPTWEASEAFAFCDSLRRALIHALPGMDDAPWEWDAQTIRGHELAAAFPH
jgi:hypothetical protein